jgi:hypothetical protein
MELCPFQPSHAVLVFLQITDGMVDLVVVFRAKNMLRL